MDQLDHISLSDLRVVDRCSTAKLGALLQVTRQDDGINPSKSRLEGNDAGAAGGRPARVGPRVCGLATFNRANDSAHNRRRLPLFARAGRRAPGVLARSLLLRA